MDSRLVTHAKDITRHWSKSFSFAALFLPRRIRDVTYVLYAFFRSADEIVDSGGTKEDLDALERDFYQAYAGNPSRNHLVDAVAEIFQNYHILPETIGPFFKAMRHDCVTNRIQSDQEFLDYAYGAGGVVGVVMAHVMGASDEALFAAGKLGQAMQITNCLRDVKEDYDSLGRIYLPEESLRRHGLDEIDIGRHVYDDRLRACIAEWVIRARVLYTEGEEGISLLPADCRRAIRLASAVYARILDKIEANDYNVWAARVRVSLWGKIMLLLSAGV